MWSIGIYVGTSPFHFHPPQGVDNPVLSSRDISDVPARFVADPFMVRRDGTWYMFFEVMNQESGKGEIGLATSPDGFDWAYRQIVLDEPYHLSYPYVFEWGGDYYMTPETLQPGAVRLYRADSFPDRWSCVGSLLDIAGADPSVFYFDGKWWMLVCTTPNQHDTVGLYSAELLTGPWAEHPKSPVVSGDLHTARPGGRVLVLGDRVIRYAQDCYPKYGTQVRAFEISVLTPTDYVEEESAGSPVFGATGAGWNAKGMHHIDPHQTAPGEWIACVDGRAL